MIYAHMREDARKELEAELKTTTDAKWYRRVKIIDLSSRGHSVPQLAQTFDVCPATVRDYIKRYNRGGLKRLRRRASEGPPPKVPQSKPFWQELLRRSPCQFGKLHTAARNWTQELLVRYCQHYLGVAMTQSGISVLFQRLGLRWNRSKLTVSSPDPLYTVKRQRVETLKKKRSKGL